MVNMIVDRLNGLLAPCVEAMGYELADLELKRERRGQVLRLFIDRDAGIGLDDCERVSGQVSALLDVEDPIPGHYSLEVSSPGLDRKLAKPEHFDRFAGRRIRVRMRSQHLGRRNFGGTLLAREGDVIELDVNDGTGKVQLNLQDIFVARLAPDIRVED
ncbi:MAG: ribosome maturation factor RimP [Gammaproteobacteria bacterium]|nr:ribosome maturation factor RimP [Gammaproteobacteria bacterium]